MFEAYSLDTSLNSRLESNKEESDRVVGGGRLPEHISPADMLSARKMISLITGVISSQLI